MGNTPPSRRAKVKTPINFWPSLDPWLNAMNAADRICNRPKTLRTVPGRLLARLLYSIVMIKWPPKKLRNDEHARPISTLLQPAQTRPDGPAVASPAPVSPAINAWLSLVGKP